MQSALIFLGWVLLGKGLGGAVTEMEDYFSKAKNPYRTGGAAQGHNLCLARVRPWGLRKGREEIHTPNVTHLRLCARKESR